MEPTNTIRFFESLAQRMYHENDLFDMVYALCLSNSNFKQFFLDFFFKGKLKAENVLIEREVSYLDGSRPDFVIRAEGYIYFVEVKIWDRCHHFAQYSNTLKDLNDENTKSWQRLGYITNYQIEERELGEVDQKIFNNINKIGQVKRWSQFIKELKSPENNSWNNSEEVQGLIAYCEKVCPDNSDELIGKYVYDSDSFEKTKKFYDNLSDFLKSNEPIDIKCHQIRLDKYRVANTPSEAMGFYFGAVDDAKSDRLFNGQKVWGWVGIRLKGNGKTGGFCIAFDNLNGWGKPIFDRLNSHEQWMPFFFDFPEQDQELGDFLKNAFGEVFSVIINQNASSRCDGKDVEDIQGTPYYAIRSLPLFIKQKVFPMLQIEGCRILPFSQKDTYNPSGWCGEYFSVAKPSQQGGEVEKEVGRFWVGTYYDGRKGDNGKPLLGLVCERIGVNIVPFEPTVQGVEPNVQGRWEVDVNNLCEFIANCVKNVCN